MYANYLSDGLCPYTGFSRTDKMPYRKKRFHDTAICTFFFAFSRAENKITRAEKKGIFSLK